MFGVGYKDLGLRKKDRELSNNRRIFRAWGRKVVEDRVNEIKGKIEKGEISENPKDIIEAITINSLKNKKEGEITYTNEDFLY